MRVAVYKNLNKRCWSIAQVTRTGGRGKVLRHAEAVVLSDVQFIVRESRRLAVVAQGCREVHAWATGELVDEAPAQAGIEVTYNPYRAASFTLRDGTPVHDASLVVFTDRAWICQKNT